jgi:hypothetical protein
VAELGDCHFKSVFNPKMLLNLSNTGVFVSTTANVFRTVSPTVLSEWN